MTAKVYQEGYFVVCGLDEVELALIAHDGVDCALVRVLACADQDATGNALHDYFTDTININKRHILTLRGALGTERLITLKPPGDAMPSVRLRGVRAKVTDRNLAEKVQLIRALLGNKYRIIIEEDDIRVEGNMQDAELRKKIVKILAS